MVTLLAKMVPPQKESKMREKRGKDTLEQAASMMMVVSTTSSLCKISLTIACYLFIFSLFNAGRYGGGRGSPGLLEAP